MTAYEYTDFDDYIVDLVESCNDFYVSQNEGASAREIREYITQQLVPVFAALPRNVHREASNAARTNQDALRARRRKHILDSNDVIIKQIESGDPLSRYILNTPYPTGENDGTMRTLGAWKEGDWIRLFDVRDEKAVETRAQAEVARRQKTFILATFEKYGIDDLNKLADMRTKS